MPKITDNQYILEEDEDGEQESFDISNRILQLNDELSVEIIEENIRDHIADRKFKNARMNYVSLYKERLEEVKSDPDNIDLKSQIYDITESVIELVKSGLKEVYGVSIGLDTEDSLDIYEYLDNVEALYEFFFIRNYQNIVDLLYSNLLKKKQYFIDRYKEIYNESEESDIFISYSKKKFKNFGDAIIANYITDILFDIKSMYSSALDLFTEIVNLDLYELYNNRVSKLLLDYGEGLIFENDADCVERYFDIMSDHEMLISIRNDVLLKYLELVEADPSYGNN